MDITNYFKEALNHSASDIFIIAGKPFSYRVNGQIVSSGEILMPSDTKEMISQIYAIANRSISTFESVADDDFSFSIKDFGRFRVNTYMQRNSMAAVLRIVLFELPNPENLHIPNNVLDLYKMRKGLILVTGSAGSGKSTTLACLIDKINKTRNAHIITLEDPLEYLHRHEKSIVSQREVFMDTPSYEKGLRAALRESPDVILLGEMRDFETISIAMSAAETGQLVLSTLHTIGAANTIDRIIDVFPPNQQQQVRVQLSMILQAVVSQQLIPSEHGKLVPAFEIMIASNAIRNMIRESKIHQINSAIYSGASEGMVSMDTSIQKLLDEGKISEENAELFRTSKPTQR